MPTLIELSPEESERLGVSQLFEVPAPINGERHPEFIRRPGEEWDWNGNHNDVSTGAHKESGSYRFACRATPEEIAAQGPSVGRPADLPENIQWLPRSGPRVETGPLQVGDDWPGVFIRGDNAGWYALQLTAYLTREDEGAIPQLTLRGLVEVLSGCILGPAKDLIPTAPSVGRDVHQFFAAQGEWSQATFGSDQERGCIGPLKHLEKEAREAYTETDREKRHMEIVDCFFLTCDSARRDGMSFDDLLALAWKKLEINKARQWSKPTSDEPVEHVRNEGAPQ